jgi:ADP-heptose:LPS heptosyltransferase
VFRALQLGDLLCAVPALRALRTALPDTDISLIGLPWAESFVSRFSHYLDGFLSFPGYPGLPEQPAHIERFPAFLTAVQRMQFDIVLQMHGSGTLTNSLVQLFGADITGGFYYPGHYCPNPRTFMPYPVALSEVQALLALLEHLGVPAQGDALEFPLTAEDEQTCTMSIAPHTLLAGSYACVHPGARLRSRRWWPERFAVVADALAAEGLQIVLTGAADELPLTQTVAAAMHASALDLAGRTTLGALGCVLRGARVLVCNDTGVSHVAAALRVPSVVIACGSDTARWAPSDQARHHVVYAQTECRPCAYETCPIDHRCAAEVTPELVINAIHHMLSSPHPSPAHETTAALSVNVEPRVSPSLSDLERNHL